MTGKSLRDELAALIETWRAAVKQSASGYYAVGFDEGQIACADELAAILSASPHDGCTWRQDDEGAHDTDCGQRFQFTDEGAKENGAKFCCYCGKPLIEVVYKPDWDDDDEGVLPLPVPPVLPVPESEKET